MTVPRIFDPHLRALRRDRALARFSEHDFLHAAVAEELLERLADVSRSFADALVIGALDRCVPDALAAKGISVTRADPGRLVARQADGVVTPDEALPFPPASFDLIVNIGTLESINDLPGALIAMRQALRPDGLCLVAFAGGGSLPRLRAALLAGDGDRPAQRLHPQVDVRALGDLLQRTGFAMPVADQQVIDVRYGSLLGLLADLRGMGAAQCLASAPPPLTRGAIARAAAAFSGMADADGRTSERFVILHGSGWAPAPDQPRPARRGSATASLAAALGDRTN